MQSGKAKDAWVLEYAPATPYFTDNLMGWTGMQDTLNEIRLRFASAEDAVAYAKKNAIPYELFEPNTRSPVKKAYADNFSFKRIKSH